jgi:hypothetical protein
MANLVADTSSPELVTTTKAQRYKEFTKESVGGKAANNQPFLSFLVSLGLGGCDELPYPSEHPLEER